MPLNTIQFSESEFAEMYKNHLIDTPEISYENNKIKTVQIKFLGEFKKHILIATDYPDEVHIPDNTLSFLVKMLSACISSTHAVCGRSG